VDIDAYLNVFLVRETERTRVVKNQLGSPRRFPKSLQAAAVIGRALVHIGSVRRVLKFLKAPVYIDAFQDNPKLAYKTLTNGYLFRGLPVRDRAQCFLHNHTFLQNRLPLRALRQFLTWGIDLCEITKDDVRFTVRCGLSRPCGKEGEQSLILLVNGQFLYSIAFTIVPGYITGSTAREVILVSRIQGEPASPPETLKVAQKALSKLRFGSLLMAGLEGIAMALGIEEVVCVSSVLQLSYVPAFAERFRHAYEDLFEERGFLQNEMGLYSSPVPMKERAAGNGKGNMGDRERARHWFRQQVSSACTDHMRQIVAPELASPRPGVELPEVVVQLQDQNPRARNGEFPHETSSIFSG
jgi:uncharacterized protein VirK/YbjX